MKIFKTHFDEIINVEKQKDKYLVTHHEQTTYYFMCETEEDTEKMSAFIHSQFPDKRVKG